MVGSRGERIVSGLWTLAVSRIIFPLHERLKGHDSVSRLHALEDSQWWTRERLESDRMQRLRDFLCGIAADVPYYRDAFARLGLDPRGVSSTEDLARFPLLSKRDIRASLDNMRSERAGKLKRYNTGGSSGEPLTFYMGKDRISHDVAAKWRATRWWGVDVGDPEFVVWGSPVELGTQDRLRSVRDWLFRSELLPAFEMSETNLDRFVERIRVRRPTMLFGYPSSLSRIAEHARRRGVDLRGVGVLVAFVTSEKLYDHQRTTIEQAFGCPVANGYGGRDAGFIAHQCPHGQMHLSAEDIIVEVIDAEGRQLPPGQSGEIVVTHLATFEFPFLRYRTGDVGTLSADPCTCGRGLPVLREIEGRSTDFVVAADGTVMHGLALIYVLREAQGIERFKIIQETRKHTRVLIVTGPGFSEKSREAIAAGLARRLGEGVRIDIDVVEGIAPEKSGKYRYVVSHVEAASRHA